MAGQKGITLISLIITIVLLLIIAGTTVYTSVDRFKINNLKKMYNDIELLDGKVNNYYLKYGGLPVIKDAQNNPESYTHTAIDFNKAVNDNENYYIIDLAAIGDITLNYGKEGYENPNGSDDVYIINEKSHTVYYVRGIEYTDGKLYHSKKVDGNINEDTIPPTTPEIKVVEGNEIIENNYEKNVTLEFVPGKDKYSGVNKTTYSINGNNEQEINSLENNQYKISEKGIYEITLKTYDNNNNVSEITKTIYIGKIKQVEYLESTGTQYINTGVMARTKKYKVVYDMQITDTNSRWLGANGILQIRLVNGVYSIDDDSSNRTNIEIADRHIVASEGEYLNGITSTTLTVNDIVVTKEWNSEYYGYIMLFAMGNKTELYGNQTTLMKLYSCKIYENDILVRDFIPIIDENGVACLYDKVEGKFYYNQGTGEFKTNLDE